MQAITSSKAKEQLDELIEQVILDVEPKIVFNAQGKQAVLMSLDEFNAWQETVYLLSNPANAAHLLSSIKSVEAGEVSEKQLIEE